MKQRLTVYYRDNLSAIFITEDNGQTYSEEYNTPVLADRIDIVYGVSGTDFEFTSERVVLFLADRVMPEERQNCREVLNEIGLDVYHVLSIIRVTEGRTCSDGFSVIVEDIS